LAELKPMAQWLGDTPPLAAKPTVWLLMGYRAGENAQILAMGEGLGWPFEIKRLVYRNVYFVAGLPRRVSLLGINRGKSGALVPPWPDLVISAGFRNEPVTRWIKRRSGGRTRIVHIGRTWAGLRHFDLVATTPQYRLPDHPHVLHNKMPLHRVTGQRLAEAAAYWEPRISRLPRPYIAVMIGGHSGPYTFDRAAGERLGRQACALADSAGGSLLVTTSSRTPKASIDALLGAIACPTDLCRWTQGNTENSYFGYLALADSIIVTGDSIAMLSDACATRKPVYIFDLDGMRPVDGAQPSAGGRFTPLRLAAWDRSHIKAFCYGLLMRFGPQRLSRDLGLVYDYLVASGRAVWLGQTFPAVTPPPLEDLQRAVVRVRALLGINDPFTKDE
jgi:hypothetical protein